MKKVNLLHECLEYYVGSIILSKVVMQTGKHVLYSQRKLSPTTVKGPWDYFDTAYENEIGLGV
jgi:hypothetical protein